MRGGVMTKATEEDRAEVRAGMGAWTLMDERSLRERAESREQRAESMKEGTESRKVKEGTESRK
jgi:hypothetical protein